MTASTVYLLLRVIIIIAMLQQHYNNNTTMLQQCYNKTTVNFHWRIESGRNRSISPAASIRNSAIFGKSAMSKNTTIKQASSAGDAYGSNPQPGQEARTPKETLDRGLIKRRIRFC